MNDDALRAELQRRSTGGSFRAEDLLPAVDRAIGVRARPARFARWAPLAGLAAAALVLVALVVVIPRSPIGSTAASPGQTAGRSLVPAASGPISATTKSDDFALTLVSAKRVYAAGEPIDIHAELVYTGNDPSVTVSGSGTGLVTFPLEQLDGDFKTLPVMQADCRPYTLERGVPLAIAFTKNFGTSAEDPNRDRLMSFGADPELHLWPGQWRITAAAIFYVGSCGPEHRLNASIDLSVTDAGTFVITPSAAPSLTPPSPPTTNADAHLLDCASAGSTIVHLTDSTGLITSCATNTTSPGAPDWIEASDKTIATTWTRSSCSELVSATFSRGSGGYELAIDESEPQRQGCEGVGIPTILTLSIATPIGAPVDAQVNGTDWPHYQGPSPPTSGLGDVSCGPYVALTDATGEITRCTDLGAIDYRNHSDDPAVSNPPDDPATIHVYWARSYCVDTTKISVARGIDNNYYVHISETAPANCMPAPDAHAVDLHFNVAVPAAIVTMTVDEGLTPAPSTPAATPNISDLPGYVPPDDAAMLLRACAVDGDIEAYFKLPPGQTLKSVFPDWPSASELGDLNNVEMVVYTGSLDVSQPASEWLCFLLDTGPVSYVEIPLDGAKYPPGTQFDGANIPPTPAPPSFPPPPIQQTTTIDCSVDGLDAPVTVTDHTQLVTACQARFDLEANGDPPTPEINGTTLTLAGRVDTCSLLGVDVIGWHPTAVDVTPIQFEIRTNTQPQLTYPAICGVRAQVAVDLTLSSPVATADVDAFTTRVIGESAQPYEVGSSTNVGEFTLVFSQLSISYSAGSPIFPVASLSYEGSKPKVDLGTDREHGLVGPWVAEQLDGDLYLGNGASLGLQGCDSLTNHEQRVVPYDKPQMPVDGPPHDARLQYLYGDPFLILLPGTWRISTRSAFSTTCEPNSGGEHVSMTTSVVVVVH